MGFVNAWYRLVFGGERQQQQQLAQQPSVQLVGRKRSLEEEEAEENLQFDKNSLNRPIKRARMEKDGPTTSKGGATNSDNSSISNMFRTFKSLFSGGKVKTKKVAEKTEAEAGFGIGAANPFDPSVETVDLTVDLDGDEGEGNKETLRLSEECPPPQSSLSSSSSSTLATLSSFGGFTAANLTSLASAGHVVSTSRENRRRLEAASPEKVKARLVSRAPSRHENFFSEKDIAKRIWRKPSEYGGVTKSGKKRGRTAFHHTTELQERERYRTMLEKYGVIKYSALTERTDVLRSVKPGSLLGPGPVRASLDLMSGVRRVDEPGDGRPRPMLTSTVMKPGLSSTSQPATDLAASPVLARDQTSPASPRLTVSAKSPAQSFLTADDTELAATVRELTSPEFLERLHRKYGASAREREMQIQREESRKKKCEKDTENIISLIDERLESHLKITQAAVDETPSGDSEFDDSQPTEMPALTNEMTAVIKRSQASRGEVLVDAHKIQITVKDLDTLSGLNWLNDEIINFYMQMIVARAAESQGRLPATYAFNTFFYSRLMEKGYTAVKRWTKKVDLFTYSVLLIPVHLGMHWCLAVVDVERKVITYYDSMGGNNKACVTALASYLEEEHQDKKKSQLDTSDWSKVIAKKIPQQMNGSDCGMFTCKFAEYTSRRARFTFSQKDMPYFRRRMVYEIVKNTLMCP